jgi:hypothetical protein
MKPETRNLLDVYGNIIIYVLIIMGTVAFSNLLGAWPSNTPQIIIIIMSILVIFDVFRQVMMDPKKGKRFMRIIILIAVVLAVLIFAYLFWFK